MIVIRKLAKILGHLGSSGACHVGRQVARRDPQIQGQAHCSRADSGQQRINDGVGEDPFCIFVRTQSGQCRNHCQRDGGHGDKLEQTGKNRRHKVKQFIQGRIVHPAQSAADNKGCHPQGKLLPVPLLAALFNNLFRLGINLSRLFVV